MPIITVPLAADGAVVDLLVGVSEPRKQALVTAQQGVPAAVQIRALIDTGATLTCVEESVLKPLNLVPTGQTAMVTPSTGPTPAQCNQYDVSPMIIHPVLARLFHAVPIIERKPLSPNFKALLGRDLLKHCLFVYDSEADRFSLAF